MLPSELLECVPLVWASSRIGRCLADYEEGSSSHGGSEGRNGRAPHRNFSFGTWNGGDVDERKTVMPSTLHTKVSGPQGHIPAVLQQTPAKTLEVETRTLVTRRARATLWTWPDGLIASRMEFISSP